MNQTRALFSSLLLCVLGCTSFAAAADSTSVKKYLPTVSVAEGVMSFFGDVGYDRLNQPFFGRNGFQIQVQRNINTRLSFSLFLLSGKVFGDQKTVARTLNFESGIVSEGIQLRYEYVSRTNPQQVLIPFVSAGVEYVTFHPKADLKDANGNYYHYWKDGSIRNLAQTDSNASQAVVIHRDYTYESELRDANIDGFGQFKETAIAFPVGAGVRFKISGRCSMDFSAVCHFINSDLVDGVTSESVGQRRGNSRNDRILYSSVSFRYDFSAARETSKGRNKFKPNIDISNVDFASIAREDADHDGVPDISDDAALNPEDVKVDANGRPLDSDNDGIPDYRDLEPNSAKDALVNENGVTITEEMIEEQFKRDSLAALPSIVEYLKGSDRLSAQDSAKNEKTSKNGKADHDLLSKVTDIPKLYRKVDLDFNGVISPQEISAAIDEYLAGKSSYTSEQFYRLIDFFFKQH